MNIIFWDVETNNFKQNRIFQLAFQVVHFESQKVIHESCSLVRPFGWALDDNGYHKGRFTHQQCWEQGKPIYMVLDEFIPWIGVPETLLVAHNSAFDTRMLQGECDRLMVTIPPAKILCTMQTTRNLTRIPNKANGGFKAPSLAELHRHLFKADFEGAHSADVDVDVLKKCFFELVRIKYYDL